VAVAAAVRVARAETIAAAAPQQRKALLAELCEERRKVRDDQGREAGGRKERLTSSQTQRLSHQIGDPRPQGIVWRNPNRPFKSRRQTPSRAIPSDVAGQRKIIRAETKNPFKKCIFAFDPKKDIGEPLSTASTESSENEAGRDRTQPRGPAKKDSPSRDEFQSPRKSKLSDRLSELESGNSSETGD
jgi:hypothetical protein